MSLPLPSLLLLPLLFAATPGSVVAEEAASPARSETPTGAAAAGSAEADWQAVLALNADRPSQAIRSREEARTVALAYLAKRETALRRFLEKHPGDPHVVDAEIQLAHLLATRSDLSGQPELYEAGVQLLDKALAAAPGERRVDLAFSKIALAMRRAGVPSDAERESLTGQIHAFQREYPNDRRVAELLVEIATLYDKTPKAKEKLLKEALKAARSDEVRARIGDDLKRLALLGQPVTVKGTAPDGTKIDSAKFHGKVVLLYFFASWSPPSIAGLEEIVYLRKTFPEGQVAIVGISLDPSRAALEAITKPRGVEWPILWESLGWGSPLIRSLAINALPTLWILDRQGRLRTLNARTESELLVRQLLKES